MLTYKAGEQAEASMRALDVITPQRRVRVRDPFRVSLAVAQHPLCVWTLQPGRHKYLTLLSVGAVRPGVAG